MKKALNTIGWILSCIGFILLAGGNAFGIPCLVVSYFLCPDIIQ